jgi:hypothetical protein
MGGGFYAAAWERKRRRVVGEQKPSGDVSIKKDFRRGGSIPPPEVRHGLNSR